MKSFAQRLAPLLSLSWEDAVERFELSGLRWKQLESRLDELSARTGLHAVERDVLAAVAGHQLSGDQWLPMLASIEELSSHLGTEASKGLNPILAGTSRLLREQWLRVTPEGKWRLALEVAAALTLPQDQALQVVCSAHPGWKLWQTEPKSYPLWCDEEARALQEILDPKRSESLTSWVIISDDLLRDAHEVVRVARIWKRPVVQWHPDTGPVEASPLEPLLAAFRAVVLESRADVESGAATPRPRSFGPGCCHIRIQTSDQGHPGVLESALEITPRPRWTRGEIWEQECRARGITLSEDDASRLRILMQVGMERVEQILDILAASQRPVTFAQIAAQARRLGARKLEAFSKCIEPRYQWDDLVLPARTKLRLAEVYQHIVHRGKMETTWNLRAKHNRGHGVTIVFEGDSGTGKTMAAEVLAHALGLSLFQVDLSKLTSKYVGDTEKNLARVFEAAREACGILLFDEGESLFSKRSDAQSSQDRYANLEVNFLLQELESYDGIVVISTNLAQNIDAAFLRRITFHIHFPAPDVSTREAIWRNHLGCAAGAGASASLLGEDVDLKFLAQLPVTGGVIKNVARLAAGWATRRGEAINMRDVLWGIRREFSKLGISLERDRFGETYWKHVSPEWEAMHATKRQEEMRPHEHSASDAF